MEDKQQFLNIPVNIPRSYSFSAGQDLEFLAKNFGKSLSISSKDTCSSESLSLSSDSSNNKKTRICRKIRQMFEQRHDQKLDHQKLFLSPRWQHQRASEPHLFGRRRFSLTSTGSPVTSNASSDNNSEHNSDCGESTEMNSFFTVDCNQPIEQVFSEPVVTDQNSAEYQSNTKEFELVRNIFETSFNIENFNIENFNIENFNIENFNIENSSGKLPEDVVVKFDLYEDAGDDGQSSASQSVDGDDLLRRFHRKMSPGSMLRSMSMPIRQPAQVQSNELQNMSLPRVTISDFSTVEFGNVESVDIVDADDDTPYVTLDDVAKYKSDLIYNRAAAVAAQVAEPIRKPSKGRRRASLAGCTFYGASMPGTLHEEESLPESSADSVSSAATNPVTASEFALTLTSNLSLGRTRNFYRRRRTSMSLSSLSTLGAAVSTSTLLLSDEMRSYTNSTIGTGDLDSEISSGDDRDIDCGGEFFVGETNSKISQKENQPANPQPQQQQLKPHKVELPIRKEAKSNLSMGRKYLLWILDVKKSFRRYSAAIHRFCEYAKPNCLSGDEEEDFEFLSEDF